MIEEGRTVRDPLVGALFDAWDGLDLVLDGVTAAEMVEPWGGGSAFAWTYGHVANSIDAWLNVRFQGLAPHHVIGNRDLRFGGSGRADDWATIARGATEVRAATRRYLRSVGEPITAKRTSVRERPPIAAGGWASCVSGHRSASNRHP